MKICFHCLRIICRILCKICQSYYRVHRCSHIMAHIRQETRLCVICSLCIFICRGYYHVFLLQSCKKCNTDDYSDDQDKNCQEKERIMIDDFIFNIIIRHRHIISDYIIYIRYAYRFYCLVDCRTELR